MKNLFMCLLLSVSTVNVFAQDFNEHQSKVNEKGFELLYKHVDSMHLVGEVKQGEKLKDLLQDTSEFFAHAFGGIFSLGDDEEDEKDIKLESAAPHCKTLSKAMNIGRCELQMHYKTGEKVKLVFDVKLKGDIPVALHSHSVMVHRK